MRVKFRILLYRDGKKLTKEDLKHEKSPFWIGVRYITEFKYLEATKWLMIAEDCYEKYALLSLINFSLGQEEQGKEFYSEALKYKPMHSLKIFLEIPEKNLRFEFKDLSFQLYT
ncbi:hypothetical protein [Thermocrinis jamiesonii]|jgi:hypothetical protein|uniref:hypothetical protein n=1 Tax=Thermocrinis jamiesonii TaxID=1302351 RepID=UPI0004967874|nr:hypothetical protein [Thermocrinis jamiesonii]